MIEIRSVRKKKLKKYAEKFVSSKIMRTFATQNQNSECENSSVGRAQPCQGWGRGFESRFSLKVNE